MPTRTTVADYSAYSRRDYTPSQAHSIAKMIEWAENWSRREAGYIFHDQDDTENDPSRDWVELICLIVEKMWYQDGEEEKTAIHSPFATERQSDYSYTVAADRARELRNDPRIAQIIAIWKAAAGSDGLGAVVIMVGPTRDKLPEYDPDLLNIGGDVSRGAFWGDEEP